MIGKYTYLVPVKIIAFANHDSRVCPGIRNNHKSWKLTRENGEKTTGFLGLLGYPEFRTNNIGPDMDMKLFVTTS